MTSVKSDHCEDDTTRGTKAQEAILSEKKQNVNCVPVLIIRTIEMLVHVAGQRLGGNRKVKSFIC